MTGPTIAEIRDLAEQVTEIRPDWDQPATLNALIGLRERGTLPALTAAALRAAANLAMRTPQAIAFAENWRPADDAGDVTALGPLPECAECGQPAARTAALSLRVCPTCGATWRPVQHAQAGTSRAHPTTRCGRCGHHQRGRVAHCSACGEPMPAPTCGPRPPDVDRPVIARAVPHHPPTTAPTAPEVPA